MVETTGVTIGIHPGGDDNSNSGTVSIGFMVTDINDAKALLEKNNLMADAVIDDGKSGIYINFKDPDGTAVYFVEPKWTKW